MHAVPCADLELLQIVQQIYIGDEDGAKLVQTLNVLDVIDIKPSKHKVVPAQPIVLLKFSLYALVG